MIKKIATLLSVLLLSFTLASCSMLEDVLGSFGEPDVVGNKYSFTTVNVKVKRNSPYDESEIESWVRNYIAVETFEFIDEETVKFSYEDGSYANLKYCKKDGQYYLDGDIPFDIKLNSIVIDFFDVNDSYSQYCDEIELVFEKR